METLKNFFTDYYIFIILGLALVLIILILLFLRSRKKKYKVYTNKITELDRDKVRVIHTPINHELAKLNKVIKNKNLMVILQEWNDKWSVMKKDRVREITNAILSIEDNVERKRFKDVESDISKCQEMIDKLREEAAVLHKEINELTTLEDTLREKFTKLKAHFRDVKREYIEREAILIYMKKELEEKFEETTAHITTLENAINVNEYESTDKMFEDINSKINVLEVLVDRLPDLIIIVKQIVPRKIVVLENTYAKYIEKDIYLDHLEFDHRIEEIKTMSESVMELMKKLSFKDTESQINGIVEYVDNIQELIENEVKNYYIFNDNYNELTDLMNDTLVYVNNLKDEIEKVKVLYEINDFDEDDYLQFESAIEDSKLLYDKINVHPNIGRYYYDLNEEVLALLDKVKHTIADVKAGTDKVLSLRADEQRAREQIIEIQYLVDKSRQMMKRAKLPVVPGEFRTYVADAKDGIKYIFEELNQTPISVDVLNQRVDTSLELAYKLYNNTKRIIKEAMLAESAILYGNRYRSSIKAVDTELNIAEQNFFEGNYHDCLNITVNILEKTEPGIYTQLKKYFEQGGFNNETNLS